MRKFNWILMTVASLGVATVAHAQDYVTDENGDQPGATDTTTTTTTTTERDVMDGFLRDELLALKPQLGVLGYNDALGNDTARFAAGLTAEMNLMSFINTETASMLYLGPVLGVIYSHVGPPDSNFFGRDTGPAGTLGSAGANLVVIPLNLKGGVNIGEMVRLSLHGGGNYTYRSVRGSLDLGPSSAGGGDTWRMYPNVGGDIDIGLGEVASLGIRPDVTVTPGDQFYTVTASLGIPLT